MCVWQKWNRSSWQPSVCVCVCLCMFHRPIAVAYATHLSVSRLPPCLWTISFTWGTVSVLRPFKLRFRCCNCPFRDSACKTSSEIRTKRTFLPCLSYCHWTRLPKKIFTFAQNSCELNVCFRCATRLPVTDMTYHTNRSYITQSWRPCHQKRKIWQLKRKKGFQSVHFTPEA